MNKRIVKEGQIYRHYKGDLYQVVKIAYNTEADWVEQNNEVDDSVKMVIYKPVSSSHKYSYIVKDILWVRPYSLFIANIFFDGKEQPRFVEV